MNRTNRHAAASGERGAGAVTHIATRHVGRGHSSMRDRLKHSVAYDLLECRLSSFKGLSAPNNPLQYVVVTVRQSRHGASAVMSSASRSNASARVGGQARRDRFDRRAAGASTDARTAAALERDAITQAPRPRVIGPGAKEHSGGLVRDLKDIPAMAASDL